MLEILDKMMHLRLNFDACPVHSPFGFMHFWQVSSCLIQFSVDFNLKPVQECVGPSGSIAVQISESEIMIAGGG